MPAARSRSSIPFSPPGLSEVDFLLAEILVLPPGADRRPEGHGGPAGGPDAGREDPVCAPAPGSQGRLDPRTPGGVLPLVRHRGRGLSRRQHVRQRAADDQDSGDRDARATTSGTALKPILDARPRAKVAPGAAGGPQDRQGVDPRRTGARSWNADSAGDATWSGAASSTAPWPAPACHRFGVEGGGVGPDLTAVAGRFSVRDLLESIVEPSKVISDQYAAVSIATKDGRIVTGRVGNIFGDSLSVIEDMFDPGRSTNVRRGDIEEMKPSAISLMPAGLLNSLTEAEIEDLVAYLLARGN